MRLKKDIAELVGAGFSYLSAFSGEQVAGIAFDCSCIWHNGISNHNNGIISERID